MDLGLDKVIAGLERSRDWLLGQQDEEGFWCGELEADVMLEADYIFMHTLLGTGDAGKMERAVNEILRHQNEDGGWSLYPGGPSNINYGVKSYLALKLMGWSKDHPVLVKALVRAFRWKRMLDEGRYASVRELADGEGVKPSYAAGMLRLTLLAPDLVEAILDGRQPEGVTLPGLMKPFPVEWPNRW